MKLRRTRTSRRGRIEIIPMIDVMFFLLATFMLTSLAMQRLDAVRVNLPQGHAERLVEDKPVTLAISRTNEVFVDQRQVTLAQVTQAIAPKLHGDSRVIVAADDGASHGVVVQAMLAAQKAGAVHFLVAVHRE
ncbi:MAG TPA: biopolymer transporter ExbD [Trinickia sp.]|nr:biopolymer transporter ExbD [Trinickia sp.]